MGRTAAFAIALAFLTACTQTGAHKAVPDTLRIAQQREPRSLNPALEN